MQRTTYTTRNSTYVVEETASGLRVKREGEESPYPHRLAETGVWVDADYVGPYFDGLIVTFPGGGSTLTSTVHKVETEVVDEAVEVTE